LLFLGLAFVSNSNSNEKQAEACYACHGKSGTSQTALTPSLGGQPSFFVIAQLFLFREARRNKSGTPMDAMAQPLKDDDLRSLAALFSRQPPPKPPAQGRDEAKYARGKALVGKRNCAVCHNPDFSGRDQMPRLAAQREDYLLKAMRDYRKGDRIGYGSATMPEELAGLSEADLGDIAHYLAYGAR